MPEFFKKKIVFKISAIVFLCLIFLFLSTKTAEASFIEDIALKVIGKVLSVIISIVESATRFIVGVGSDLLNYILVKGQDIPDPIKTGWDISLSSVNALFIFGLLYIAFATIFRVEEYGYKKLLPRFIIIALLINFSWFFAVKIFEISNALQPPLEQAGERLAGSVELQKINKNPEEKEEEEPICYYYHKTPEFQQGKNCDPNLPSEYGGRACFRSDDSAKQDQFLSAHPELKYVGSCNKDYYAAEMDKRKKGEKNLSFFSIFANMIFALVFNIIFMILIIIVLFAYFILFLVRNIAIWILLVLAPFAWAFMIFPATRKWSSEWWNKFFYYCIFAPIALFFLRLALLMKDHFNNVPKTGAFSKALQETGFTGITLANFMAAFAIGGLAIGGLIVAQKLGIAGAGAINKGAKLAGKKVGQGAALRAAASLPRIPGLKRFGEAARAKLALQKMERKEPPKAVKELEQKLAQKETTELHKLAGRRFFGTALQREVGRRSRKIIQGRDNALSQIRENPLLLEKFLSEQRKAQQKKLFAAARPKEAPKETP